MAQSPREIGDFSVLPISMPPLPAYPKRVVHHMYLRRNAPRVPTEHDSRSLFAANVPVDSTEAHFRALFVSLVGAGKFESVAFESERMKPQAAAALEPAQAARLAAYSKKRKRDELEADLAKEQEAAEMPAAWSRPLRKSGSSAVVVLADAKSVELVLKAVAKLHRTAKYPVWGDRLGEPSPPALGPSWLRQHNRLSYPDMDVLQSTVDAFFAIFNRKEQEAAELAKRLRNEPDEDGFVTVTRGGRNAPARRDEAEEAKRKMLQKEEKKRTELGNFYRFQMRERKKAEQAELIKKFEEDRRKVSAMKEKRGKFRPQA